VKNYEKISQTHLAILTTETLSKDQSNTPGNID